MITAKYTNGNNLNFYDYQLGFPAANTKFLLRAKMKDYPFEKSFYCLNSSGVEDYFQFILRMTGGTENLSGGTIGVNAHMSAGTYTLSVYADSGNTFNWSAATFLGYDELLIKNNLINNALPPVPLPLPTVCLPVTITDHSSGITVNSGGVYSCVPFSSVTVIDNLAAITANTLSEGQTYTCTAPSIITSTKTFSFPSTSAEQVEKIRIDAASSVNLAAATLSNVASVVYRKNNTIVTGTQSFAIGDYLQINITRTNGALSSSVQLVFTYTTDSSTTTTPDYKYCKWTNLLGGTTVDADTFGESIHGLRGGANGTGGFDKGANSVDSFSGVFTIENRYLEIASSFGLNTSNSEGGTFLFNRAEYMIYCAQSANFYVYENGNFKANLVIGNNNATNAEVQIKDTGTAIEFWYRVPGGAWTLGYTSVSTYFPNRVYYIDRFFVSDGNLGFPAKIYE